MFSISDALFKSQRINQRTLGNELPAPPPKYFIMKFLICAISAYLFFAVCTTITINQASFPRAGLLWTLSDTSDKGASVVDNKGRDEIRANKQTSDCLSLRCVLRSLIKAKGLYWLCYVRSKASTERLISNKRQLISLNVNSNSFNALCVTVELTIYLLHGDLTSDLTFFIRGSF